MESFTDQTAALLGCVPSLLASLNSTSAETVHLARRELLFERKQLPQVVDIRHFGIGLLEHLEAE
jgi:hypothetical protein